LITLILETRSAQLRNDLQSNNEKNVLRDVKQEASEEKQPTKEPIAFTDDSPEVPRDA
jgi:hypothetical protein